MSDDESNAVAAEKLKSDTAIRLRAAGNSPDQMRAAVAAYISEGYKLGLGPGELVDFFCSDTPNIVESVGYQDGEADRIVALFDDLHNRYRQNI